MLILALIGMHLLPSASAEAKPEGVLKQAVHWNFSADWLDPATTSFVLSGFSALYLFHDALLKPMPDGAYSPCLAESWTVSPDAKVYEFRLRRGVKFHNGDPMTAEDVVFSFWRYKAAQAKAIQGMAEKVEAVNPYLVRFRFKVPYPDFLEQLFPGVSSIAWVVPKNYIEKVGEAGFKKHPVGCGPYKFVEFVPGVKLVGEAFEEYWRKVPNVKRIELYSVVDMATRLAMVKRGEMDAATLMTGGFYEETKKDPNLRLIPASGPARWYMQIASQWDPKSPWSNPKVRKAASLSIDRQTLADVHMPGGKGVGEFGLPGDPNRVEFPPDPYDPAQAKKLLAEAGYPNGFAGGTFYPMDGGYWAMGEQIATYLRAIGITLDTRLLDKTAWMAYRQGKKMINALFFEGSQPPTIGGRLAYLFGSTSYGNYPDIQDVWNQYLKTIDPKERRDLIARVQNMIHERTMYILLVDTKTPSAFGPKVRGNPFKIQPLIWFTAPFEDIELND